MFLLQRLLCLASNIPELFRMPRVPRLGVAHRTSRCKYVAHGERQRQVPGLAKLSFTCLQLYQTVPRVPSRRDVPILKRTTHASEGISGFCCRGLSAIFPTLRPYKARIARLEYHVLRLPQCLTGVFPVIRVDFARAALWRPLLSLGLPRTTANVSCSTSSALHSAAMICRRPIV